MFLHRHQTKTRQDNNFIVLIMACKFSGVSWYNIIVFYRIQIFCFKVALSAKIVNFFYQKKLSDMIDALIKRVSVTYKCYECTRIVKKRCNLLVFWDRSRNGRHLINYRHCFTEFAELSLNQYNNALISYFLWICF